MRAVGHISEEANSYINKGTDPCGVAHDVVKLLQTLIIDTVEDLKELPAITFRNE